MIGVHFLFIMQGEPIREPSPRIVDGNDYGTRGRAAVLPRLPVGERADNKRVPQGREAKG